MTNIFPDVPKYINAPKLDVCQSVICTADQPIILYFNVVFFS